MGNFYYNFILHYFWAMVLPVNKAMIHIHTQLEFYASKKGGIDLYHKFKEKDSQNNFLGTRTLLRNCTISVQKNTLDYKYVEHRKHSDSFEFGNERTDSAAGG